MKPRPYGFMADDKIDFEGEIFDYIRELHEYLWKFVRVVIPKANGNLSEYVDLALNKIRRKREREGEIGEEASS